MLAAKPNAETFKRRFNSINSERGSIQILLFVILSLITMTSMSILGILHSWRNQAALQLRLDECVENAAHLLEKTLNRVDSSNLRMIELRALILAQGGAVPSTAPLRALLQAEYLLQESSLSRWNLFRTLWMTPSSCVNGYDLPRPLAEIPVIRPAPDVLGPQPFIWKSESATAFHIGILNTHRRAGAKVSKKGEQILVTNHWKAKWADFY